MYLRLYVNSTHTYTLIKSACMESYDICLDTKTVQGVIVNGFYVLFNSIALKPFHFHPSICYICDISSSRYSVYKFTCQYFM